MNDIHDNAQAYALGALTSDEAAVFETHLASCVDCRHQVAALADVTSALADSVAAEPPPSLRAAVLAEIAATPQDRSPEPAAQPAAWPVPEPTPLPLADRAGDERAPASPAGTDPSTSGQVVPLRRSRVTVVSSLLAAAAVLAAIVFGGLAIQSRQDANDATAQTDQLTQLLSADDVRTVPGVSQTADHPGTIVMSRSEGLAMFVASGLPTPPQDKVYEAWTISGSTPPVPAGTFRPDGSRSMLQLPSDAFKADTMAITVEPDGGSDHPTSDAVVTFTMPQA